MQMRTYTDMHIQLIRYGKTGQHLYNYWNGPQAGLYACICVLSTPDGVHITAVCVSQSGARLSHTLRTPQLDQPTQLQKRADTVNMQMRWLACGPNHRDSYKNRFFTKKYFIYLFAIYAILKFKMWLFEPVNIRKMIILSLWV